MQRKLAVVLLILFRIKKR